MKSTVITHFFNEEYLLPWWLDHHTKIFDHGILIDHNSTDNSVEICKKLAPNWDIHTTKLSQFDAWLNDFEVMTFENQVDGWKIALNVTEFFVPSHPLTFIQDYLSNSGKKGVACSGIIMVDINQDVQPDYSRLLVEQKTTGIDENFYNKRWKRRFFKQPEPTRNRFFHSLTNGIYTPGRHRSQHPDWGWRSPNMFILHYAYSPWFEKFIDRKLHIKTKIPVSDINISWGVQHLRDFSQLENDFQLVKKKINIELLDNNLFKSGLQLLKTGVHQPNLNFSLVKNR